MVEKVKELRVKIDGLAQLTDQLRTDSYQICNAYEDLILGKAWLGKVLGALGTESPYPKDGTRKTVEDIEPTADSVKILDVEKPYIVKEGWDNLNHIEKVDWLRQEISKIVEEIKLFWDNPSFDIWGDESVINCVTHLSEARFWLGFELERIRNEK